MIGQKYHKLTILKNPILNKRSQKIVLAKCDCGKEKEYILHDLKTGHTKSCGCHRKEKSTIHRGYGSFEYSVFKGMKSRCNNPRNTRFNDYGGRGIKCLFGNYQDFLSHVGKSPSTEHSIDRFPDNNGNYEPGNVRWATKDQQALNKRFFNKTGLPRGVRIGKSNNKIIYRSYIKIKGKTEYLGTFPTIIKAEKTFLFAYFRNYLDLPPEYI